MATINVKSNWFDVLSQLVEKEAIPDRGHRILLYGPPGTGKSSFAGTCFASVERVTLHPQMPPEDLLGMIGLNANNGGTNTTWSDGPAVRAMRKGGALVLDEIDRHSPELCCALHALLDDKTIAGVTLPTGERVEPAPGFVVFATTNADPGSLPDALLNRFDFAILANKPIQGVLDSMPSGLATVVKRAYERDTTARWTPALSVRSALALVRMASVIGQESAAELIFGDKGVDLLASIATVES